MTSKSSSQMNQVIDSETADSRWKGLYEVGGAAALITPSVNSNPDHHLHRLAATQHRNRLLHAISEQLAPWTPQL